jgi:hypothetical protein
MADTDYRNWASRPAVGRQVLHPVHPGGAIPPALRHRRTSVIQVKEDLKKGTGDSISIALLNRLTNQATTGSNVLEGNEEDMVSRSMRIYIDKRRNAVRIPEMEEIKSAIDLRDGARSAADELGQGRHP